MHCKGEGSVYTHVCIIIRTAHAISTYMYISVAHLYCHTLHKNIYEVCENVYPCKCIPSWSFLYAMQRLFASILFKNNCSLVLSWGVDTCTYMHSDSASTAPCWTIQSLLRHNDYTYAQCHKKREIIFFITLWKTSVPSVMTWVSHPITGNMWSSRHIMQVLYRWRRTPAWQYSLWSCFVHWLSRFQVSLPACLWWNFFPTLGKQSVPSLMTVIAICLQF